MRCISNQWRLFFFVGLCVFVAPFPFALTAPLNPFCKVAPFPVFLYFLVAIKAPLESQSQITVELRLKILRENMKINIYFEK